MRFPTLQRRSFRVWKEEEFIEWINNQREKTAITFPAAERSQREAYWNSGRVQSPWNYVPVMSCHRKWATSSSFLPSRSVVLFPPRPRHRIYASSRTFPLRGLYLFSLFSSSLLSCARIIPWLRPPWRTWFFPLVSLRCHVDVQRSDNRSAFVSLWLSHEMQNASRSLQLEMLTSRKNAWSSLRHSYRGVKKFNESLVTKINRSIVEFSIIKKTFKSPQTYFSDGHKLETPPNPRRCATNSIINIRR